MDRDRHVKLDNGRKLTIRPLKHTGDFHIEKLSTLPKKTSSFWVLPKISLFKRSRSKSSRSKSSKGGKKRTLRKKTNKRKTKKIIEK